MKEKLPIWIFGVLVFVIPLSAFGVYMLYERNLARLPVYGKADVVNGKKFHTIPDFRLNNQAGKTITISDWDNKIVVADFFFSHCPVICPKMTNSLKRVQCEFGMSEIVINSFSIDPERDNPSQLQRYVQKFSIQTGNWNLLTGDKKEIYKLARKGFMIVATDGDGGADDFIHSEKLILIDKHKRIRGYYDGTNEKEVDKLIDGIKKLKHEH